MPSADGYDLGYRGVDGNPHLPVLIATMEATARWDATQRLRGWERDQLRLAEGQRLLDVGCGLGDAALALAEDLGPAGELVGIDASAAMLAVARARSHAAGCAVRFSVGDALAIDEPDRSFDAVRCERTLQWVAEPRAAIAEMARVLRSGGRMALIDSDWSTFHIDVEDRELADRVTEALRCERSRPSHVGRRLRHLVKAAGLRVVAATSATQRWTRWDPDTSPAPDGCFSMQTLAADLVAADQLEASDVNRFVATIHDAARRGRFAMSLTMFAAVGRAIAG